MDIGPVSWAVVASLYLCCSAGCSENLDFCRQVPEKEEAQENAEGKKEMEGWRVPGKDSPEAPALVWTGPQLPCAQCAGQAAVPLPMAAAWSRQPALRTRCLSSGTQLQSLFSRLLSLLEPGNADGALAQQGLGIRVAPQPSREHPVPCSLQSPSPAAAGCRLGIGGVPAGEASVVVLLG